MARCSNCGKEVPDQYCPDCGRRIAPQPWQPTKVQEILIYIAAALAAVLFWALIFRPF